MTAPASLPATAALHRASAGRCDLCAGRAGVVLATELIVATCDGGHRWTIAPASLGQPCSGCGCPLRRPDHVDETLAAGRRPWPAEGWGARVVRRNPMEGVAA